MRYVTDSALVMGHRVWQLRPPQPSLTIIVKGTYEPDPKGGVARLVADDDQLQTCGGEHWDDDVERSLKTPSDFALFKPKGESFVTGRAWATPGTKTSSLVCRFRVGTIETRFAVFGDRSWSGGLIDSVTDPEPFESLNLSMERAYGGPDFADNPYGRGREEGADGQLRLPNLENPAELIGSTSDSPDPVVVGPLSVMWPARQAFAGTYGDDYQRVRWPWFPEDFDWRFFLEAPEHMRLPEGFFSGDERVEADYLSPEDPKVRTTLPGVVPRVFIDECDASTSSPESRFREVAMKLDTITWNGDVGRLVLTWRGIIEVPSEQLDEIAHVYMGVDPIDALRTPAEHRAQLEALLRAEEDEEDAAEGEDPPEETAPELPVAKTPAPADADSVDSELTAQQSENERVMADLGVPAATPEEEVREAEALTPAKVEKMLEGLAAAGVEVPEAVAVALRAAAEPNPEEPEAVVAVETPEPELDGRELVEMLVAAGHPLSELDLSGADLSKLDLSGQDLSDSLLIGANLSECNLGAAQLLRATLDGAALARANLAGADLTEASLDEANAEGADFMTATLVDASLNATRLVQARLTRAICTRASFVGANLERAVAVEADFFGADFDDATLNRADLSRARLSDVSFEDAEAHGATFDGGKLADSDFEGLQAKEASFRSVDASDTGWERAELSQADFALAKLTGADFSDAVLIGANLDGCELTGATFDRANAHSLRARKANLLDASFESTTLSFADLRGSNLFAAQLWRAKLDDAQFVLANVERTLLDEDL